MELRPPCSSAPSSKVWVQCFVRRCSAHLLLDYEQVCLRDPDYSPQYAATGNGIALMANRISYAFNLHGPSETVDTGCSGSLVAVHNAVQSLKCNESSLVSRPGVFLCYTNMMFQGDCSWCRSPPHACNNDANDRPQLSES